MPQRPDTFNTFGAMTNARRDHANQVHALRSRLHAERLSSVGFSNSAIAIALQAQHTPQGKREFCDAFEKNLRDHTMYIRIILLGGSVVAGYFCAQYASSTSDRPAHHIQDLIMDPLIRGWGLGNALLANFESTLSAQSHRSSPLTTEAFATNFPLLRFYRRRGFQEIGPPTKVTLGAETQELLRLRKEPVRTEKKQRPSET